MRDTDKGVPMRQNRDTSCNITSSHSFYRSSRVKTTLYPNGIISNLTTLNGVNNYVNKDEQLIRIVVLPAAAFARANALDPAR